jgi:hypothetical protein
VTRGENNLHAFQNGLMTELKYTKEQHLEVLDRYHVKGEKQSDIAKSMNVSKHFVNDLIGRGTGVRSQGLGDDIEKLLNSKLINPITKGVKKLLWKNSEDCGCDERKVKLNQMFPYGKQPLCLTEVEFHWFQNYKSQNATHLTKDMADQISQIWSRIFQARRIYRPCTCNPREWSKMVEEINKVYETYEH